MPVLVRSEPEKVFTAVLSELLCTRAWKADAISSTLHCFPAWLLRPIARGLPRCYSYGCVQQTVTISTFRAEWFEAWYPTARYGACLEFQVQW